MRTLRAFLSVGLVVPSRYVWLAKVNRFTRNTIKFKDIRNRPTLVTCNISGRLYRLTSDSFLTHASVSIAITSFLIIQLRNVFRISIFRSRSTNVYRLLTPRRFTRKNTNAPWSRFFFTSTMFPRSVRGIFFTTITISTFRQARIRIITCNVPITLFRTINRICLTCRNERRITTFRIRIIIKAMGINKRRNGMIHAMLGVRTFTRFRSNCFNSNVKLIHMFRQEDRRYIFFRQLFNVAKVSTNTTGGRGFFRSITRTFTSSILLCLRILMSRINAMSAINRSTARGNNNGRCVFKLFLIRRTTCNGSIRRVRFYINLTSRVNMSFLLGVFPSNEACRSPITYCVCFNVFIWRYYLGIW